MQPDPTMPAPEQNPQPPAQPAYAPPPHAGGYLIPSAPQAYYVPTPKPISNGMALASMIVGIASVPLIFCCYIGVVGGIVACALGGVALYNSREINGVGKGQALTGLICGGVAVLLLPLVIFVSASFGTFGSAVTR